MSAPNTETLQLNNKTGRDVGWVSSSGPAYIRAVVPGIVLVAVPAAGKTLTISESADAVSWAVGGTETTMSQYLLDQPYVKIEGDGNYVIG